MSNQAGKGDKVRPRDEKKWQNAPFWKNKEKSTMDKQENLDAAETVQMIDLPRLVRQSCFGTVRLTIGCMNRICEVTYYNENSEKQEIRGTSKEIADHINSLQNEKAQTRAQMK